MTTGSEIDVVYIGGSGRSGSTLVLRLLGSLDGVFPVGELVYIWSYGLINNNLCSCGKPFHECEFWNAVMHEAFGGKERVDARRMTRLYRLTRRWRYLPFLASGILRPDSYQRQLSEYTSVLEALYRAIQTVSNCDVIVDSSKQPQHAFVLAEIPNVRARMIHLVRDSRAVAYSWQRNRRTVDVPGLPVDTTRRSSLHSARVWMLNHTVTRLAARRFEAHVFCRYEDLAAQPRRTLDDLVQRLGLPEPARFPFVADDAVCLGADHSVMGNPGRFEQGVITIRPDMEWREKMPARQQMPVLLLTLPWLAKYGYLSR